MILCASATMTLTIFSKDCAPRVRVNELLLCVVPWLFISALVLSCLPAPFPPCGTLHLLSGSSDHERSTRVAREAEQERLREVEERERGERAATTTMSTRNPENDIDIPIGLTSAKQHLTEAQFNLCENLARLGQDHLFESWDSMPPATKRKLAQQLQDLDEEYGAGSGGLLWYIRNARVLLENSRQGVNPLKGWTPTLPTGQVFEFGTKEYEETEALGIQQLGAVGFVLVAGGLGERLGYGNIKLSLPTEMTTETCYLQHYIEYILAVQADHATGGRKLPLCIMTSGDTNDKTMQLLQERNYFGMDKSQITIVKQGQGVPALCDNKGKFVLTPGDPSQLVVKPHGHGDIHKLLYTHGVARRWQDELGIQWLCLFQDTNGLAFHTLPLMLGVSTKMNLIMNSLCVPRKAKQAIGGIARLVNDSTGEVKYVNIICVRLPLPPFSLLVFVCLYAPSSMRPSYTSPPMFSMCAMRTKFTTSLLIQNIHERYIKLLSTHTHIEREREREWAAVEFVHSRVNASCSYLHLSPFRLLVVPSKTTNRTLNVEYNQLDPLLRSTKGFENGDENDSKTGYSPFPGNINQLLFKLDDYRQALDDSKGLMPEFVNPKYADPVKKTVFKSPTRLECMMQDFPTILNGEQTSRVGFTSISADLCFSPVKNATADGVALQAQQTNPGTAASGVRVRCCCCCCSRVLC
jgi:hypothetical protein